MFINLALYLAVGVLFSIFLVSRVRSDDQIEGKTIDTMFVIAVLLWPVYLAIFLHKSYRRGSFRRGES